MLEKSLIVALFFQKVQVLVESLHSAYNQLLQTAEFVQVSCVSTENTSSINLIKVNINVQ